MGISSSKCLGIILASAKETNWHTLSRTGGCTTSPPSPCHHHPIGVLESDFKLKRATLTHSVLILRPPSPQPPSIPSKKVMPLSAIFNYLRRAAGSEDGVRPGAYQANTNKLQLRFWEVVVNFWDLGFTAFGGPPVHFQILRQRFVDEDVGGRIPWIDEQTVSLVIFS